MNSNSLEQYMDKALEQAHIAFKKGEIPIGAVIVLNDQIIASSHNCTVENKCSNDHAEMLAIKEAQHFINDFRLNGALLFSTVEPCIMCTFAAILARIDTIIYGTADPKFGGLESLVNVNDIKGLNHRINVIKSIREKESAALMKSFFKDIRSTRRGG